MFEPAYAASQHYSGVCVTCVNCCVFTVVAIAASLNIDALYIDMGKPKGGRGGTQSTLSDMATKNS